MYELSIDYIYSDAYLFVRNGNIIDHFSQYFDEIDEPSLIIADLYDKNKKNADWKPRRRPIPNTQCLSYNEIIPYDKQVRKEDCPHMDYEKIRRQDIEMRKVVVSLFKK